MDNKPDSANIADELRLRESYLTAILENQPGLVWLKDVDSRFLTVNQAFADSCGKASPAELIGKTDLDIWPHELAEKYRADDARIIKTKTPVVVEEPIFDHGKTKWFETFKTPILDNKGDVIGTTGYSREITERKQAEEDLRKAHEQLAATLNALPDLLFETDLDGRIHEYRAPKPELLYVPPESFLGKTVDEILPPDAVRVIKVAIKEACETGFHWGAVYSLQMPSGIAWFELSISTKDRTTSEPRFIVLARDITDRKKAEEEKLALELQFQQTQKLESLGVLAGGIAHDFNNILAIIMGNCNLAGLDADNAKDYIPDIEKAAERAAELCRQMLAYAGKAQFVQTNVDFRAVAEEMAKMLRKTIPRNTVIKKLHPQNLWVTTGSGSFPSV